jgi:hypothetical protein
MNRISLQQFALQITDLAEKYNEFPLERMPEDVLNDIIDVVFLYTGKNRDTHYVKIDLNTREFLCTHCGVVYRVDNKASLNMVIGMSKMFIQEHACCQPM